jgi:DNA-binding NarL/FixJ family response regulator
MGGAALASTRVLVADDHALMRKAIALALEKSEFEIIGEASVGTQVLSLIGRTQPDLVLLDLLMPGMDGITCLRRIRTSYPTLPVVVLSAREEAGLIERAFSAGASGYIIKRVQPDDLAAALRQVMDGTVLHVAASSIRAGDDDVGLTDKEREVLRALADGRPNKEIARALWVTEQTVKFHLTNVYRKLGVANRAEAVRWAYEHGLTSEPVASGSHANGRRDARA